MPPGLCHDPTLNDALEVHYRLVDINWPEVDLDILCITLGIRYA